MFVSLYRLRYLAALVFLYLLAPLTLASMPNIDLNMNTSSAYVNYSMYFISIIALLSGIRFVVSCAISGEESPANALAKRASFWLREDFRGAGIILTYILVAMAIFSFGTMKSTMPQVFEFSLDEQLIQLDRALFFGRDPYQIMMLIAGRDLPLVVISFVYQAWLLLVVAFMTWSILRFRDARALRYNFSMVLSFFLSGTLCAYIFSSAGPCFLEKFGNDHYAPLMAHLRDAHERTGMIWSLTGQEMLWQAYVGTGGKISGISAMPSLHNVFAFLWVLTTWKWPILRTTFAINFCIVFVGSIVLGWHYAVDAFAGVFLAIITWRLAGILTRVSLQDDRAVSVALLGQKE